MPHAGGFHREREGTVAEIARLAEGMSASQRCSGSFEEAGVEEFPGTHLALSLSCL